VKVDIVPGIFWQEKQDLFANNAVNFWQWLYGYIMPILTCFRDLLMDEARICL